MNRCTWVLSLAVIGGIFCTQAQAQLSSTQATPFGNSSSSSSTSAAATPFSGGSGISGMFSQATSAIFGAQILGNSINQGGANQLGSSLFNQGGLSNRGLSRGQFNNRNNRGNQGNGNNTINIRTVLRIGFTPVRPTSTKITTNLQKQFDGIDLSAIDSGISVSTVSSPSQKGSIAVLKGTVSSAHRRTLAGKLAMLEPGVVGVDNQLIVSSAPSSSTVNP